MELRKKELTYDDLVLKGEMLKVEEIDVNVRNVAVKKGRESIPISMEYVDSAGRKKIER
jgi:hypothetical protein